MKPMLRRLLFGAWCLLAGVGHAVAQSQLGMEDYSYRLSEHMVTDICQDARGFLWFATWNGLHRFDGYEFKNYKTYPGEECVMTSNRLLMIRENRSGNIWCLDNDHNGYLFNPREERFYHLRMQEPQSPIRNIFCCADSTTYITTNDRLLYIDERRFDAATREGMVELPFAADEGGLGARRVVDVVHPTGSRPWIVTDNALVQLGERIPIPEKEGAILVATSCAERIYLVTANGRLATFIPAKRSFEWEQLPIAIQSAHFLRAVDAEQIALGTDRGLLLYAPYRRHFTHLDPAQSGCGSSNVVDFYCDKHHNHWMHTDKVGVVRHDPATGEMQHLVTAPEDIPTTSATNTTLCFEDWQGTLWVMPRGGGLGWFDRKTKRLQPYCAEMQQPATKFSPAITFSYLDRQGNLWYTGVSGLFRLSFSAANIRHRNLDKNFETRALMNDLNGRLWVATKKGYIRIYNADETLAGYLAPDGHIRKHPCRFEGNVYCFFEDHKGAIWMGTRLHGLVRLDPINEQAYRVTRYQHDPMERYSLSGNSIYDLFEDSHNRLWVCTYGGGINCIQSDDAGQIRFLHAGNELTNWPIEQCYNTRQIVERQGVLLVGTTAGLVTFAADFDDPRAIRFYRNYLQPNESSCLPANDVHSIFTDSRGDSYVMSFAGGVSRILSEELLTEHIRFHNYSSKDGLSSELSHTMVEDGQGMLWIIYENAIDRFNPRSHEFEHYSDVRHAYTEAHPVFHGDHLVVGTANGLAYIPTRSLKKSDYVPPIALSSLTIQNTGEERMIDHLDCLELHPHQRDIQLSVAALDYADCDGLRYAWRMKGLETEWHHSKGQPIASYTNLPAGEYFFEVYSTNSDGVWVENLRTLKVAVLPTFWETPLAIVLLIVVTLALLLGAIQLRLHIFRLRNRIDVEQHMTDIKLRFFTDVSHELRTPLTLIASPVNEVLQHETLSERGRHHLQIVSQNTQRMLRLINQILDFRKIENGKMRLLIERCDVGVLTERIAENFRPMALRQRNDFTLNLPERGVMGWIDRDKVEKICFNLLSNAFKYTPEGRGVSIDIQVVENIEGGVFWKLWSPTRASAWMNACRPNSSVVSRIS